MFVSTLFVQAVLAVAALALPNGMPGAAAKRTVAGDTVPLQKGLVVPVPGQSNADALPPTINDLNIAGAAIFGPQGDFTVVAARLTLGPVQRVDDNAFISRVFAQVALDADAGCPQALFGGVQTVLLGERVAYTPFYQWGDQVLDSFNDLDLNENDDVEVIVVTAGRTQGAVHIIKNGGEQRANVTLSFPNAPLCLASPSWLVGRSGDPQEPLPNFGEIVFQNALAVERGRPVHPSDPRTTLFNLVANGTVIAKAGLPGPDSVSVTYTGTQ